MKHFVQYIYVNIYQWQNFLHSKNAKNAFFKSTCKNNRIWIQVCNAKTVRWWQEMEALSWSLTIIHDMSGIQRDHQKMTKMTFPSPSRSRMSWKFFLFFIMMSVQHDPIRGCIYGRLNLDEWWVYYSSGSKTLEQNFYFN